MFSLAPLCNIFFYPSAAKSGCWRVPCLRYEEATRQEKPRRPNAVHAIRHLDRTTACKIWAAHKRTDFLQGHALALLARVRFGANVFMLALVRGHIGFQQISQKDLLNHNRLPVRWCQMDWFQGRPRRNIKKTPKHTRANRAKICPCKKSVRLWTAQILHAIVGSRCLTAWTAFGRRGFSWRVASAYLGNGTCQQPDLAAEKYENMAKGSQQKRECTKIFFFLGGYFGP